MEPIRIEFGMPFKGQNVAPEWEWGIVGIFSANVDYGNLARRILKDLPHDAPPRVTIKAGDRVVARWSRY
jgi:hypothetical protein